jgi:hypothetical protein
MPRSSCLRGASPTSSTTAWPDRDRVAARRYDAPVRERSRGFVLSSRSRRRRNFPPASWQWQLGWRVLARSLLSRPFTPRRTAGVHALSLRAARIRIFAMGTFSAGTLAGRTSFGSPSSCSAVQHGAATRRHVRRGASNVRAGTRARLTLHHAARPSSFRELLTLLKRAVEFSRDKIAPALPGFHVMNERGWLLLRSSRSLARFEVALTRSEHER